MHALQNHLLDNPVYDGNAYAFTATFLSGYLNLYSHHVKAPAEPGQRPGYHITQETQDSQQTNVELAILHHAYGEDDADDTEVTTGFATSFASSFTSVSREEQLRSQRQPKMPRSPPSPSYTRQFKRAS
ncbi:hypothetical protein BKA67DRAFT_541888 [Truncatella angustata]|uniref:Uncharacterized protein n=1 Tax=Truncatella angustata TaxID=152316 RepID=A0A9P8RH41_9PEZI|nr:uncharacterized protein BKA67DRAFT_541888 [Truncatella angustata]KAH6645732.1 hypothetical protein BKA67DRAFT_541888 [Truncatella angustata]